MAHGKYPKDRTRRNVIRGTITEEEVNRAYGELTRDRAKMKKKGKKIKKPDSLFGPYPGK